MVPEAEGRPSENVKSSKAFCAHAAHTRCKRHSEPPGRPSSGALNGALTRSKGRSRTAAPGFRPSLQIGKPCSASGLQMVGEKAEIRPRGQNIKSFPQDRKCKSFSSNPQRIWAVPLFAGSGPRGHAWPTLLASHAGFLRRIASRCGKQDFYIFCVRFGNH